MARVSGPCCNLHGGAPRKVHAGSSPRASAARDNALMAPALELVRVTKRFGNTEALSAASLGIPEGAIAALIGPNGAGKSTMIKCWLGFERPTHGVAQIAGYDPGVNHSAVLRQVGYLAQGSPLYSDLSVRDHLTLARGLRASFDSDYARERLRHLGIPLAKPAGRLSGGQQAQVALAIVLATHPSVLLLDEPLASLDPLARREFLNTLVETAHREGQTVLISSHIVSDMEHACDLVVVLAAGRLLLAAPVVDALGEHVVGPVVDAGAPLVGVLPTGHGAEPRALFAATETPSGLGFAAPSLEELVLGYLAGAQRQGGSTP